MKSPKKIADYLIIVEKLIRVTKMQYKLNYLSQSKPSDLSFLLRLFAQTFSVHISAVVVSALQSFATISFETVTLCFVWYASFAPLWLWHISRLCRSGLAAFRRSLRLAVGVHCKASILGCLGGVIQRSAASSSKCGTMLAYCGSSLASSSIGNNCYSQFTI